MNLFYESEVHLPSEYGKHNQNWDIVQNDNGVVFIANGDGLLEFDGYEWTLYKTKYESSVLSLSWSESHDTLYAGGIGEFGYFHLDSTGHYNYRDLSVLLHDTLKNFGHVWYTKHHLGKTYFMSASHLFVFDGKNYLNHARSKNIFSGQYIIDNKVLVEDRTHGLFSITSEHNLEKYESLDENITGAVYNLFEIAPDTIIAFCQNNIFYKIKGKEQLIPIENELPYSENGGSLVYSDVIQLKNGEFALSVTKYGFYIIDAKGNILDFYDNNKLNFGAGINKIYEDYSGIIWITTNKGVSLLHKNLPYKLFKEQENYSGVANAFVKHKNDYYLGTNEGVYKYSLSTRSFKKLPEINIYTFDFLCVGENLLATSMDGLYLVEREKLLRLNSYYSRTSTAINTTEEKNIFLTTGKSSFAIQQIRNNNKIDTLLHHGSFPDEIIRIVEDRTKDYSDSIVLWAGLISKGLARISIDKNWTGVKYQLFSENHGLGKGYVLPSILDDTMYFFGKTENAFELDKKNKFIVSKKFDPILNRNTSYLSAQDHKGNIYLEATGPLFIMNRVNNRYEVDSTTFKGLGLGYLNAIYFDDLYTWLIWEQGITQLFTNSKPYSTPPLKVIFRDIFYGGVNNVDLRKSGSIEIPFDQNDINFRFSAPYYLKNNELLYSFMLEGYDKNFSPWIPDRKAFYTNLPEGNYVFKVRVKNHQGIISDITSYAFKIQTPWYRSILAYSLYILGFILLIWGILRLNAYRLKAANLRLQKIVQEKTKEIRNQNNSLKEKNTEIEQQRYLLEEKNQDIIDSINYAKRIQTALLQSEDHVNADLPEHFVYFKPKDIVSGDFYWAREKMYSNTNYWYVTVGDCTGHGVPGAFLTMLATSFLNETILDKEVNQPAFILEKLREKIIQDLNQNDKNPNRDGMDMSLIKINLSNYELEYSGAFNPLWIVRGDEIIEIKGEKFPVSYQKHSGPFINHKMQLLKGDTIYLFSDGFVDQFGGVKAHPIFEEYAIKMPKSTVNGKKLKSTNFKKLVLAMKHEPMPNQKDILNKCFDAWKGDLEQIDDVCIIGIRI